MDLALFTAVSTAVIAPSSTLLAVALTLKYQLRTARETHAAQHIVESMKLAAIAKDKRLTDVNAHFLLLHETLSYIAREYSLTSISIMLDAKTNNSEYAIKHLKCCERLDKARALADMHFSDAHKPMEELYGQMSIFWYNYTEVCFLAASNESGERRETFQAAANQAALVIGELAAKAKERLNVVLRRSWSAD